jgi:hypothetical protein
MDALGLKFKSPWEPVVSINPQGAKAFSFRMNPCLDRIPRIAQTGDRENFLTIDVQNSKNW